MPTEFHCKHVVKGQRKERASGYCWQCWSAILNPTHDYDLDRLEFPLADVEYEGLLALQGGVCALCGNSPHKERRLHPDYKNYTAIRARCRLRDRDLRLIGKIERCRIPLLRIAQYLDPERITPLNIYQERV